MLTGTFALTEFGTLTAFAPAAWFVSAVCEPDWYPPAPPHPAWHEPPPTVCVCGCVCEVVAVLLDEAVAAELELWLAPLGPPPTLPPPMLTGTFALTEFGTLTAGAPAT
jgi:hypothetical protein